MCWTPTESLPFCLWIYYASCVQPNFMRAESCVIVWGLRLDFMLWRCSISQCLAKRRRRRQALPQYLMSQRWLSIIVMHSTPLLKIFTRFSEDLRWNCMFFALYINFNLTRSASTDVVCCAITSPTAQIFLSYTVQWCARYNMRGRFKSQQHTRYQYQYYIFCTYIITNIILDMLLSHAHYWKYEVS